MTQLERFLNDRPWQQKVSERAIESIRAGKTVLLDAPTGSGKSLIALEVGSQLLKSRHVDHVYIGVRTINEMTPFERDIHHFYGNELDFTYLVGKKRSCPFYSEGDDAGAKLCEACLQLKKGSALSPPRRIIDPNKVRLLMKQENYTLHRLKERYVQADLVEPDNICLFHSVKDMPSDFTLMTYPYIFSSKPRKSIDLESLLGSSLVIIDEAHNTEDITSLFERRLSLDRIRKTGNVFSKIANQGMLWIEPKEVREVEAALSAISELVLEFADPEGKSRYRDKDALKARLLVELASEIAKIRRISNAIQNVRVEILKRKGSMDLISDPFSSLIAFLDDLNENDSLELFSDGLDAIVLRVVDPSVVLSILKDAKGLLLMSGTLPSADYIQKVWSLGENPESINVERDYSQDYHSVFPRNARTFEFNTSVTTTFVKRTAATWSQYAEIIERAFGESTKSVLVCCPSYDLADKISQHLKSPFIVEQKKTSHAEIASKLNGLSSRYIVLSVARGKLLEGVEFTSNGDGQSLIDTVVIAGIPYSVPDEYHDYRARRILARLNVSDEDPNFTNLKFEYFLKQPALVTVRQAIGRAIRSPEDRVKVLLLDSRFAADHFWKDGLGLVQSQNTM